MQMTIDAFADSQNLLTHQRCAASGCVQWQLGPESATVFVEEEVLDASRWVTGPTQATQPGRTSWLACRWLDSIRCVQVGDKPGHGQPRHCQLSMVTRRVAHGPTGLHAALAIIPQVSARQVDDCALGYPGRGRRAVYPWPPARRCAEENAICFALSQGWLAPVGAHGNFTVYRGGGYCFHSLIGPEAEQESGEAQSGEVQSGEVQSGEAENLFVESKPRKATEMRLADALATLQALP